MSAIQGPGVPLPWRALIATAWTPYGRGASTLETVYGVVAGGEGSGHDRFLARKLLEEADAALLFSAIRRSGLGYATLAEVAERVGARAGDNVATIRDRAARHGDRNIREIAGASRARHPLCLPASPPQGGRSGLSPTVQNDDRPLSC